jgi:hypothetical protein
MRFCLMSQICRVSELSRRRATHPDLPILRSRREVLAIRRKANAPDVEVACAGGLFIQQHTADVSEAHALHLPHLPSRLDIVDLRRAVAPRREVLSVV